MTCEVDAFVMFRFYCPAASHGESALSDKDELLAGERGVSIVAAAIGFVVFSGLAIFAIVAADDVALWIRVCFVLAACFFGWLLFLAPANVRVAVARWFS